jgi:hypothetical protein
MFIYFWQASAKFVCYSEPQAAALAGSQLFLRCSIFSSMFSFPEGRE